MSEYRLIKREDIKGLRYTKMPWDVCIKNRPYQVIDVDGFVHTIGGHLDFGNGNSFWTYPLDEEMNYDNLIEFDGCPGARWGLEYYPTNYIKTKWDKSEVRQGRHLIITRNEKPFYDGFLTIHEALSLVLDNKLSEHPLNLNNRDFDKNCVGRKIWYRSEPAIIERYVNGQACIIIKPDGMERFSVPKEHQDSDIPYYEEDTLKVNIFSKYIWWFRE